MNRRLDPALKPRPVTVRIPREIWNDLRETFPHRTTSSIVIEALILSLRVEAQNRQTRELIANTMTIREASGMDMT